MLQLRRHSLAGEQSGAGRFVLGLETGYDFSGRRSVEDLADALAGRATLGEQVRQQQAQTEAESARFRLSDLRYRNGVASYLDLLDAQRSLFTVQQATVQTRLAELQNQVSLYQALGGGWTDTTVAQQGSSTAR